MVFQTAHIQDSARPVGLEAIDVELVFDDERRERSDELDTIAGENRVIAQDLVGVVVRIETRGQFEQILPQA